MRILLDLWIGLAAGGLAARARWPLAPDLVEASDLAPWREVAALAVGLALALGLAAARPARLLAAPGLALLGGALLGAATALLDPATGPVHGPFDGPFDGSSDGPLERLLNGPASAWLRIWAEAWPWLLLGIGGVALAWRLPALRVGAPLAGEGSRADAAGPATVPGPVRAARVLPLALLAAGVTEAVTALARLAARTMPDASPDDAARGMAFAALLVVGAFAFGRPFTTAERGAGREPLPRTDQGATVALVVAAFATFAALVVVGGVTTPRGLRALMLRFDLDVARSGTLTFDVLVALAAFVLPAFALGAALHLVRTRAAWLALAVGAAIGVLRSADVTPIDLPGARPAEAAPAVPPGAAPGAEQGAEQSAQPSTAVGASDAPDPGSAGRVLAGLCVAGLGALAAAALTARGRARLAFGAGGAAAVALGLEVQVPPIRVLKAYERFQPVPAAIVEGPSGQILVDPGGAGLERVSLDHRTLVPGAPRARGDRDQLAAALTLLDEPRRARGARVLLVGPLSPGRALTLAELGAARVDRSAGYWRDLAALERFLARRLGPPAPDGSLHGVAGEVLAPTEARRRAARGDYDVVIVPAAEGNRPDARFLDAPPDTVQVLWLEARDDAAGAVQDARVLIASSGAEHFVLGRLSGATPPEEPRADVVPFVPLGPRAAAEPALARLRRTEDERHAVNEAAFAARFAAGARGTAWEDLAAGLVLHLAAQRPSSPFESSAQRVELDRAALDRFFAHATLGRPDRFTLGLWNGLVEVLRAKRDVVTTYELVEPLAELWAPWSAGTLALAWADGEELDHEGAIARLAPLVRDSPGDRTLVLGYAEALITAERPGDAAAALATLSALDPEDRGVRKALARAQVLAKDPGGRALALELLREEPEDRELWGLLSPLAGARPGAPLLPEPPPEAQPEAPIAGPDAAASEPPR